MNLKNIKERQPEQQLNSDSAADNKQVSPLAQNRLLSAALSVEGNKLIAEFMKINVTDFSWNEHLGLVHCDEYGDFQIDEDLQYYSPNSSWNDLMPVVEKIQKVFHWDSENDKYISVEDFRIAYTKHYPTDMNVAHICICTKLNGAMSEFHHIRKESKSKIESVWLAVVEFIEWYNVNTAVVGSR